MHIGVVPWRDQEIAAGHEDRVPQEWELEGPAVSISLGDAADIDPALLAAICGPDGLGTLLGWSTGPAHAGAWRLLGHEEARADRPPAPRRDWAG